MASWIEIPLVAEADRQHRSRLMWPRGLKSPCRGLKEPASVEAYVASWIEIHQPILEVVGIASRLMWPRGLKLRSSIMARTQDCVEAYVASWIEMLYTLFLLLL